MKRLYIILSVTLAALTGAAQGLNNEITVDREITVNQVDVKPLNLTPDVILPPLTPISLTYSNEAVTSRVPDAFTTLEPIAWSDPMLINSCGYASLGLFPLWNASLSAGYRIITTDKTRLNAWLQYSGEVYRRGWRDMKADMKPYWRDHTITADVAFSQKIGQYSSIEANIDYTFAHFNYNIPVDDKAQSASQSSNNVGINALWRSKIGGMGYHVYAGYRHFAYVSALPLLNGPAALAARENRFRIGGRGAFGVDDDIDAGLKMDIDVLGSRLGKNTGVVTLTPFIRIARGPWRLEAGPRIDMTFNGDKFFHIAPEVVGGWAPNSLIAIDLRAAGGEHFNPLAELSLEAMRANPSINYGLSHIPFTVDLGVTAGPYRGFSLRLFGGWAAANSWLMPVVEGYCPSMFVPTDLRAFHGGAEFKAQWKDIVDFTARFEAFEGKQDRAYYLNRDRARQVLDLKAEIRPIKNLTVEVAWQLRANRTAYNPIEVEPVEGETPTIKYVAVDLHNVSDLRVGAHYSINPRLGVFLRGMNLLNHNYLAIDGSAPRGIMGLIGVTYKIQ